MVKFILMFLLCFTSFSSDESYSEIVFEDTPIGAIQSKLKRMKILWNKKNKKTKKVSPKKNDQSAKQHKHLSKLKKYPKLKYKKYDSFQLEYNTSYADSSDTKLFFYGGYVNSSLDEQNKHKKLRIFDYLTKSWSAVMVPYAYRVGASVSYYNNKVYIYGGRPYKVGTSTDDNPNIRLNDLLIYDLTLNSWSKINVGTARSDHSASVYNGKIYFYGGDADPNSKQDMLSMEIFDTSNNTIKSSDYTSNRVFHRSLVHVDKLYIIGGSVKSPHDYLVNVDTIEYIDLTTGEKETIDQGFSVSHPVVGIYNNKLVALGGYRGSRTDTSIVISLLSIRDEEWVHKTYSVNDLNIVVGAIKTSRAYLFGTKAGITGIFRVQLDRLLN
ncbi:MAG: hypothetical protein KC646_10965 [Candidatus Cloacimonetes bacterium]|nr:hypothetical protein [Candidatus Cloacimonadota bacterium]